MFLKRKKKYRELRFLFNKYFVDIWGRILKKKKVHNLTTKRFLTFFARYVTIKPLDNFRRKRRYYQRRPFIRKPRLVAAKVDQSKLKYLIRRNLASYMRHKLYPKNILISYWFRRARFFSNSLKSTIKTTRRSYTRRIHPPKKYIYLRKRREYVVTPLMDLVIQQHHFGFSSLKSLGHFMKRNAAKNMNWKLKSFGIEGMLASQLCRAGVVDDIRKGYILVKSGAVLVNRKKTNNPRLVLIVGDQFSIQYPFNLLIFKFLRLRFVKGLQIFNIAAYLEFNLRLMAFSIVRKPSRVELRILSYYPYRKRSIDRGLIDHFTQLIN